MTCRSKFESEDELAVLACVLLDQTDGLPTFVAETLKYKGGTLVANAHYGGLPGVKATSNSPKATTEDSCTLSLQVSETGMPK